MRDIVDPPVSLLVKLGSIAVHAEELTQPGAHSLDLAALRGLLNDPEVREWLAAADALALLPIKRGVPAEGQTP